MTRDPGERGVEKTSRLSAGRGPIRVEYRNHTAQAAIDLGDHWSVQPAQELLQRLRQLLGGGKGAVGI